MAAISNRQPVESIYLAKNRCGIHPPRLRYYDERTLAPVP